MKKMVALLLFSSLFVSGSYAVALNGEPSDSAADNAWQAQTSSPAFKDVNSKKIKPISRDSKDPRILTLLGRKYVMLSSEEGKNSDQWANIYAPQGTSPKELDFEKPGQDVIFIVKITDTTCSSVISELFGPLEDSKADSFDTRNPNDQLVSVIYEAAEEEDSPLSSYLSMRFVQAERDVFAMWVWVHRGHTPHAQWQETPQAVLSALKNTPHAVLTEHFIDSPCRFGSDCRFN